MELNLDTQETKSVKLGGVSYPVTPLKVKDQMRMQAALKGLSVDDPVYVDTMLEHLSKCGMPKDAIENMDIDQLTSLIEFLGSKKKT
jgi:hypothetical protein